jgi:hypothetical protein
MITPGLSKLENVVDPCSGPWVPLPDFDQDLGSGPRLMVVDPGVHCQGPLPSPILMFQALCFDYTLILVFLYYVLLINRCSHISTLK